MAVKEIMKYDVFISYSSNDKIIADGVLNYLKKNKIRCFIAYQDIPKGLDWAKFIPGALRNSKLMLVIFLSILTIRNRPTTRFQ